MRTFKHINFKRIIAFCLVLALSFSMIAFKQVTDPIIVDSAKVQNSISKSEYNSQLSEIDDTQALGQTDVIKFSDLYNSSDNFESSSTEVIFNVTNDNLLDYQNKLIRIDTAIDFYCFTKLCNDNSLSNARNLHYIIGADIDYTQASRKARFIEPIFAFNGIFDGQGYTISNIFFERLTQTRVNEIEQEKSVNGKSVLETISLFNINTGIIKNVGIIDLYNLQTQTFENTLFASTFVGTNYGTIENVYIQDLRGNDSGLICEGGYMISSFIYLNENTGIINNCYVAVSQIVHGSVQYQDLNSSFPVILTNNGTLTDVYFDNEVLSSYKYHQSNGQYGINKNNLINIFKAKENWYTKDKYPSGFSGLLPNEYPSLIGLNHTTIDNQTYFIIDNHIDFAYFYYLINNYGAFRNAKYIVTNNIDLGILNSESLEPSNIPFSGSIESGYRHDGGYNLNLDDSNDYSNNVLNQNGLHSRNYSIFNLTITKGTSLKQKQCFGLFPILSGIVADLNLVNLKIIVDDNSNLTQSEIKCIGGFSGYVDGGTIRNCNVLGNITVSHSNSNTTYCGMISGLIEGENSSIDEVTSNGTIINKVKRAQSSFGGVIGYCDSGNILNCLNATSLTLENSQEIEIESFIGGVIGSSITKRCEELENKGIVNVLSSGLAKVYAGGVIGLHSKQDENLEIGRFTNSGIIEISNIDSATRMYVSGVINIKAIDERLMKLTSLTNKGDLRFNRLNDNVITIKENSNTFGDNTTGNIDLHVSGNTFVIASNCNLNGVYTKDYIEGLAQEIDISIISEYAPVVRTHDTSGFNTLYQVNIKDAYNYRDITYTTKANLEFHDLKLSGCISGGNVNLDRCRNEGNITVDFKHYSLNALNDQNQTYTEKKTLMVYGVCETIGKSNVSGKYLQGLNLANTGDILIKASANTQTNQIKYGLYISGICNLNNNGYVLPVDEKNKENTLMLDKIKNDVVGLYNCVNSGNIDIETTQTNYFYGVSRIGGITAYNYSIIKNCYNLGNIYNKNYMVQINSEFNSGNEIETGGITFQMIEENAAIIDCANNGRIISHNLSNIDDTWLNSSGIVCRNDKDKDGGDLNGKVSNMHHRQKIQFSINYGDVYAINKQENASDSESHCKAAGILAIGMCSVVNVINYGNIYSVETAGGMYGLVFIYKFYKANDEDPVFISNALNYGKIQRINTFNIDESGKITTTPNEPSTQVGALIGHIAAGQFENNWWGNTTYRVENTLNKVKISYLVNFNKDVRMVGYSSRFNTSPNANEIEIIKRTLRYMATINPQDNSSYPFDLKPSNGYGIKSYSLDNANGTNEVTDTYNANYYTQENNGGIFNENYQLRNPNIDSTTTNIITDYYISDYFQYVGYSKVNDYLLDKLGLKETTLAVASKMVLKDYTSIRRILQANSSTNTLNVTNKFNETFYLDNQTIQQFQTLVFNNEAEVKAILNEYLRSISNDKSTLKNEIDSIINGDYLMIVNNYSFIDDVISSILNLLTEEEKRNLFNSLFNETSFNSYFSTYASKVYELLSNNINLKSSDLELNYQNIYNCFDESQKSGKKIAFENRFGFTFESFIENYDITNPTHLDITNQIFNNIDDVNTEDLYQIFTEASNNGIMYLPVVGGVDGMYSYRLDNTYQVNDSGEVYAGSKYNMDGSDPEGVEVWINSNASTTKTFNNRTVNVGYISNVDSIVTYNNASTGTSTNQNNLVEDQIYISLSEIANRPRFIATKNITTDFYLSGFLGLTTNYYRTYTYTFTFPTYFEYNCYNDFDPSTSTEYGNLKRYAQNYNNTQKGEVMGYIINKIKSNASVENNLLNVICNCFNLSGVSEFSIESTIEILINEHKYFSNSQLNVISSNIYNILNTKKDYLDISFINEYLDIYGSRLDIFSYGYDNLKIPSNMMYDIYLFLLMKDVNNIKGNSYITENAKIDFLSLYITKSNDSQIAFYNITNENIPNSIEGFETYIRSKDLDPVTFLDFTGIYALASSQGILNGQFIPDNLVLSDLDPILIDNPSLTDASWREEVNGVNYQVHTMMKQLKKSIATSVFKVTLTNGYSDYYYNDKDSKTDYDLDNHIIRFSIPINDNIFTNGSSITIVNDEAYYELSYKAIISNNETLNYTSLNVGETLHLTFDVQAEDRTVETTYDCYVTILGNKAINEISNVIVNNINNNNYITNATSIKTL